MSYVKLCKGQTKIATFYNTSYIAPSIEVRTNGVREKRINHPETSLSFPEKHK